jgi:hypothetical protein
MGKKLSAVAWFAMVALTVAAAFGRRRAAGALASSRTAANCKRTSPQYRYDIEHTTWELNCAFKSLRLAGRSVFRYRLTHQA